MKSLVVLFLCCFLLSPLYSDKSLFPARERAAKKAGEFFKNNLNRRLLFVKRLEKKLSSGNYFTPFIMLSEEAAKDKVLIKQLRLFEDNNFEVIEKFRDVRREIYSGNYKRYIENNQLTPLRFHLMILHSLIVGYEENEITGTMALNFWDLVIRNTKTAYSREGKRRGDCLGVVGLSSRLTFFKRYRKWRKRFSRYIKKLKTGDSDLQYVSLKN